MAFWQHQHIRFFPSLIIPKGGFDLIGDVGFWSMISAWVIFHEPIHLTSLLQVIEKFPHIADYKAFKIPYSVDIKSLLKCQLAIASFSGKSS